MPIESARNCIKPQKENTASQNNNLQNEKKTNLKHPIKNKNVPKQDIQKQNVNTRSHTKMELTRSEKLQNLKTFMKKLTKTLSIFNIKELQEEFRKQLHHLHHQAKKMGKRYPPLATPLKFILSSSLKVDKFSTMARETLLRRMYVVTREMNETLHLHRDRDKREKLLDLQHYCQTDMPIAQKEYLQIVSIALTLKE